MILGKGMSGGYFPLSAMITRNEFVDRLKEKTGGFVHGHTFSHHPWPVQSDWPSSGSSKKTIWLSVPSKEGAIS